MVKIINLDNLPKMQSLYVQHNSEDEANAFLQKMANDYRKAGYEVIDIPASEGIMFNDPHMLKVVKHHGVVDPNAPENIVVYALVPHAQGEFVTVTRNRMKYYSEAEDETNYNFVNKNMSMEALHQEMLENGYALVREANGIRLYKNEIDTFISEVYVF